MISISNERTSTQREFDLKSQLPLYCIHFEIAQFKSLNTSKDCSLWLGTRCDLEQKIVRFVN